MLQRLKEKERQKAIEEKKKQEEEKRKEEELDIIKTLVKYILNKYKKIKEKKKIIKNVKN